jgi:hypothetical protein
VVDKCHASKETNINITDLIDGLIVITKWSLELVQVSSSDDFTSYGGLEMRFIIHAFKLMADQEVKMNRFPANLYRDDEVKATIAGFI